MYHLGTVLCVLDGTVPTYVQYIVHYLSCLTVSTYSAILRTPIPVHFEQPLSTKGALFSACARKAMPPNTYDTNSTDFNPCAAGSVGTERLALRIGSVFIILSASLLGVLSTLAGKHWPRMSLSQNGLAVCKTAGSGILIACALIHLLQPANESLTSVCVPTAFNTEYQAYAYLYCMIAFLGMQCLQNYRNYLALQRFSLPNNVIQSR